MKSKVEKLKVKVFSEKVFLKMFSMYRFIFFCIVMSENVFYVSFCFSVSIEFYAELFIVMFKESCLVLSIGDGNFIYFIAPC